MRRIDDLRRFYKCLEYLGRPRKLTDSEAGKGLPKRGVYFFMEPGESRSDSGHGLRVVRVGTHGLNAGSKSTLRGRLAQHKGTIAGGGNQRGSVFRHIVGASLIVRDNIECPSWNVLRRSPTGTAERATEQRVEEKVSEEIGGMPFIWLNVPDEPGIHNRRGYIERNAIALLSNFCCEQLDPPSDNWLGHHCYRRKVRKSGLWNSEFVDGACDYIDGAYHPAFLDEMERLIEQFAEFSGLLGRPTPGT